MTTHTPGPWSVNTLTPKHTEVFAGSYLICEAIGGQEHLGQHRNYEQDVANAAFIVRACNAYDDMLAVLKAVERAVGFNGRMDTGTPLYDRLVEIIDRVEAK